MKRTASCLPCALTPTGPGAQVGTRLSATERGQLESPSDPKENSAGSKGNFLFWKQASEKLTI